MCGAPYIDVEYKAAAVFFAGAGEVPISCKVILSSHNFQMTPPAAELKQLAHDMHKAGADIVKIATMANDITDSAAVLSLLQDLVGEFAAQSSPTGLFVIAGAQRLARTCPGVRAVPRV